MSEVHIRSGYTRSGFSMVYHEVFDLYHPYIGDTATLLYLYLLRSRNNEIGHPDMGKSWRGRKGITEKFRVAYKTLPTIDAILEASGLVRIERRKSGRGRDKIIYIVNDPLERVAFREVEPEIIKALSEVVKNDPKAEKLIGKQRSRVLIDQGV